MARLLRAPLRRGLARADAALNALYGWRYNPLYQTGAISVLLLGVLIATGLYLLIFYRIGAPYASMDRITDQVWAGRWIRTLHRYSADAVLVTGTLHAVRMFVQRKTWGPRVLAWISGLVLMFALFVCGWTGYVLVWDLQAQVMAVAGARLLDRLPLFSEPLGRGFVGEAPVPSAFFFINFFLHVALPLGLGLLVWLHVIRVARPVLLPPRRLTWVVLGGLLALSVAWPILMDPEADPLVLPAHATLDLFYAFWIPAAGRMTPGSVWGVFTGVSLLLMLVPRLTRPRPEVRPAPSVVDERSCTGCEQCYHDCPYEAVSMVEREDGREGFVARVDPSLCVSCGICAASCAPMVMGPPGRSGRDQLAGVRDGLRERAPAPGEIVLVVCAKGGLAPTDAPHGTRLHPVSCAGSLHTSVIEYYLRAGAAGVLVAGCPPRDCWNREGSVRVEQRMFQGREAELQARVDRERVRLVHFSAGERETLEREVRAFRVRLALLGHLEGEGIDLDLSALCERAEVAS